MKKYLLAAISFFPVIVKAQNTFPTTGAVGIGTTTPNTQLHIKSDQLPQLLFEKTGVIGWKLGNFDQTASENGFNIGFNAIKVAYFDVGGKLGLGTVSPKAKLDILAPGGNLRLSYDDNNYVSLSSGPAGSLFLTPSNGVISASASMTLGVTDANTTISPAGTSTNLLQLTNLSSVDNTSAGLKFTSPNGVYSAIEAIFKSHTAGAENGDLTFMTIGNGLRKEKMRITALGNIGIGDYNPMNKLAVVQNGSNVPNLLVQDSGTGDAGLAFNVSGMSYTWGIDQSDNKLFKLSNSSTLGVGDVMSIGGTNLNIGIATNPLDDYKLAVNGGIIATAVTVKLNSQWPDYVFRKGYRLPTLAQLKSYIQAHSHLPEMPAADEVEKNGVDLALTNRVLTKRLEELTLHLIEMNEKLEKQSKMLKSLSRKR